MTCGAAGADWKSLTLAARTAKVPSGRVPSTSVSSACRATGRSVVGSTVSRSRALAEPPGCGSTHNTAARVMPGSVGSVASGVVSARWAPWSPLISALANASARREIEHRCGTGGVEPRDGRAVGAEGRIAGAAGERMRRVGLQVDDPPETTGRGAQVHVPAAGRQLDGVVGGVDGGVGQRV